MGHRQPPATTADITSSHEGNTFRTARRLIGQGFVEIAQGIGLITEGTLRPVRRLVPSLIALAAITAFTTATLVLVITTVARADVPMHGNNGTWTRWNSSPEIRFGDNTIRETDLILLTETEAWAPESIETTHIARWQPNR